MNKCFICNNKFKYIGSHIFTCATKNNLNITKDEVRYKQICFKLDFLFTKEYMEDLYIKNQYSLPDFKKNNKLVYSQTLFLLKYFGIKIRTIKEANSLERRNNMFKETCVNKYGCENPSQLDAIKNKKKETFLKNYGVDNIWKSKDYYVWLHQHMLDTYGKKSLPNRFGNMPSEKPKTKAVWAAYTLEQKTERIKPMREGLKKYFENLTDEQKNLLLENFNPNFSSKLETRVLNTLNNIGATFTTQFWINRKSFDFKMNKTLLEINGDFWHANPKIYKKDDVLNFPITPKTAQEIWDKDLKKKQLAEEYGYNVIYIWESDMNKMSDEELLKLLFEILIK